MPPKFSGVDFYNIDGLLSEEERAIRKDCDRTEAELTALIDRLLQEPP